MQDNHASGRGIRRLLRHVVLAGAVALPGTAAGGTELADDMTARDDEADDHLVETAVESLVASNDRRRAGRQLAHLLEVMSPFDATRTAALAATSPLADVRLAVAEALATRFRIVGDGLVLEQLRDDAEADVRAAATRALEIRGR